MEGPTTIGISVCKFKIHSIPGWWEALHVPEAILPYGLISPGTSISLYSLWCVERDTERTGGLVWRSLPHTHDITGTHGWRKGCFDFYIPWFRLVGFWLFYTVQVWVNWVEPHGSQRRNFASGSGLDATFVYSAQTEAFCLPHRASVQHPQNLLLCEPLKFCQIFYHY